MRILHLSDIQEGRFGIKPDLQNLFPENWKDKYKDILMDIKNEFYNIHSKTPIDIIVISGDLASMGSKEEFDNFTKEFMPIMEDVFLKGPNIIPKNRWLIVPGNHDVQWDMGEKKFDAFINFCKENGFTMHFKLNTPNSIFSSIIFQDKLTNIKIEILLLNSCLEISNQETKNNANISTNYFNKIKDNFSLDENSPKIMICHHRLHEISKNFDHALIELRIQNTILALVGDIHKSQPDIDVINNIKCITAGPLLAKKSERKVNADEVPRQFNVYEINLETGILNHATYVKSTHWDKITREPIDLPFGSKKKPKFEKIEELLRFILGWSQYFNEEVLRQIRLKNYEDIKNFLKNPNQWEDKITSISKMKDGDAWFRDAFFSIQSGSKGLFHAQYLDHALISVPPPLNLLEQLVDQLTSKYVLGLEAPAGWGKSRLVLWVALSFALQKKTVYYFPDPLELNEETYRSSIQTLLKDTNKVIIIDDFHLRNNSPKEISFWRTCFYLAKKNQNQILFALTKIQESEEQMFTPYNFQVITSSEYTQYWRPQWVDRFEIWFKALNNTILRQHIYFQGLNLARNTKSPWGFVSILVDLRELIIKQLSITLNANLIILFTVFVWGFAISRERGISSRELYNALLWIKNNSIEHWRLLETTGGKLWDYVNNKNEEQFLKDLIQQIEKWRQSPRDLSEIRLLPSEGAEIGPSLPIRTHHVAWWSYALEDIWENEWKDSESLKQLCKLIIFHSSPIIDFALLETEQCNLQILENCTQIEVLFDIYTKIPNLAPLASLTNLRDLSLGMTQVSDITPLGSLTNLQILNLASTNISDIKPLASLTNLQELYLNEANVSDIKPLASLTNLQILYLWDVNIYDISPLTSLANLQHLGLGSTMISDITMLASLVKLERLYLQQTNISDIIPLASLIKLQRLFLQQTKISEIKPLASLTNLQNLRLSETNVSDIKPLASLTNLQELYLSETNVSDIKPLVSLTNLEKLNLSETIVSDIKSLASLTNLQELYLNETNVSDIKLLASLTNLKRLDLNRTKVSVDDIRYLKNNLKNCIFIRPSLNIEIIFKEKLEKYQKLADENPEVYFSDVAMIQNNLGAFYWNLRRFEDAEHAYKEASVIYQELADKNPESYLFDVWITKCNLGATCRDLKRFEDAEHAYKEALNIAKQFVDKSPEDYLPRLASTKFSFGLLYKDLGRFEDAENQYKETLEIYNNLADKNPEFYLLDVAITQNELGICYWNLKRFEDAQKAYREALEIYKELAEKNPVFYLPDVSLTLIYLGITYQDLGRLEEAEKYYNEIEPNNSRTWDQKGRYFLNLKRSDKAIECYDKALEIDPEFTYAWAMKGYILDNLKRYDEAIECYDKALEIYPNYFYALYNKGVALDNLKKYDEAIECYDKALEIDPNSSLTWYNKACFESRRGNKEKAIEFLEEAIKLDIYLKITAKDDENFDKIRNSEEFRELIGKI